MKTGLTSTTLGRGLARFVCTYATFAGRRGLKAGALVLAGAFCEGISLAMIAPLLSALFATPQSEGKIRQAIGNAFTLTGATTQTAQLSLLMGLFAAALLLRAITLRARDMTLARLRIGFVEKLRADVAAALTGAPWQRLARLRHARAIQVMSAEVQQIGNATHFMTQGIAAIAMLTVQCALAIYLSPRLALIALILLMAGGIALLPLMRRARGLGQHLTRTGQHLLHAMTQFLGGLKPVISQNQQTQFLTEFQTTLSQQSEEQLRYLKRQSESQLALTTLSALTGVLLLFAGLTFWHLSPAPLLALLLIISRMNGPASQIQQGAQMLATALPAFDAIETLKQELAPPPLPAGTGEPLPHGTVVFRHVSFAHEEPLTSDRETLENGLKDICLTIAPGSCIGIRGPSGAGKTTLADLLCGLYLPQSGEVSIGGRVLCTATLPGWRARISYVTQDAFLHNGTIRRNLLWAAPRASDPAIWHALEMADAADFIRALPDGMDTPVDERGVRLSGGERQRIALACALLRQPELLILDEATNAVDAKTEKKILSRLTTQTPRPAMVIIAHHGAALSLCERVFTLNDGRLDACAETTA